MAEYQIGIDWKLTTWLLHCQSGMFRMSFWPATLSEVTINSGLREEEIQFFFQAKCLVPLVMLKVWGVCVLQSNISNFAEKVLNLNFDHEQCFCYKFLSLIQFDFHAFDRIKAWNTVIPKFLWHREAFVLVGHGSSHHDLYWIFKQMTGRRRGFTLPQHNSLPDLLSQFTVYFSSKIARICAQLDSGAPTGDIAVSLGGGQLRVCIRMSYILCVTRKRSRWALPSWTHRTHTLCAALYIIL